MIGVLRDAGRNATELFYDGLGRKQREEDPSTGTSRYYHNGFGELRREERGAGSVVDVTDPARRKPLWSITERAADGALRAGWFGDALARYEARYEAMGQPRRLLLQRRSGATLMDLEVTPDESGAPCGPHDHQDDARRSMSPQFSLVGGQLVQDML